jgi:hypothetical protein
MESVMIDVEENGHGSYSVGSIVRVDILAKLVHDFE